MIEFYLIAWTGGYEPPSIKIVSTLEEIQKVYTRWVEMCSQTEDIIDVYSVGTVNDEYILIQMEDRDGILTHVGE